MKNKNNFSWNSLISGYAFTDKFVKLFGFKTDEEQVFVETTRTTRAVIYSSYEAAEGMLSKADALISIMLDSSTIQLNFEACNGNEEIVELVRDKEVDENLRMKCGEFLLLLVGHLNRRVGSPMSSIHDDIRRLLGMKLASLIWAASRFDSMLDPDQRSTAHEELLDENLVHEGKFIAQDLTNEKSVCYDFIGIERFLSIFCNRKNLASYLLPDIRKFKYYFDWPMHKKMFKRKYSRYLARWNGSVQYLSDLEKNSTELSTLKTVQIRGRISSHMGRMMEKAMGLKGIKKRPKWNNSPKPNRHALPFGRA